MSRKMTSAWSPWWCVVGCLVSVLLCGCPDANKKTPKADAEKKAAKQTPPDTQGSVAKSPTVPKDEAKPPKDEPKFGREGDTEYRGLRSATPANQPKDEPKDEPKEMPAAETPVDLGDPLVDNVDKLKRLDPKRPVWLDSEKKRVILVGQVCQDGKQAPLQLEMFACLKGTKEHESILVVDTKAYAVHAALIALGAKPGTPVVFDPEYKAATGPEIDITVVWKDEAGKQQSGPAQNWIRNQKTGKPMENAWVFVGSRFFVDEDTKEKIYMAEGGDFICVSNFPSALLDVPVESSQDNAELMFETFTGRIPPRGTPVTIILEAKVNGKEAKAEDKKPDAKPEEKKVDEEKPAAPKLETGNPADPSTPKPPVDDK